MTFPILIALFKDKDLLSTVQFHIQLQLSKWRGFWCYLWMSAVQSI